MDQKSLLFAFFFLVFQERALLLFISCLVQHFELPEIFYTMYFWSQWLSGPHLMDSLINNASQLFWWMNLAGMSLHGVYTFSPLFNMTPIFPHWKWPTVMHIETHKRLPDTFVSSFTTYMEKVTGFICFQWFSGGLE